MLNQNNLGKFHYPPHWSVTKHSRSLELKKRMPNLPEKVKIRDVTIREGEEMPLAEMNLSDKLAICKLLVDIGVSEIEVGYVGALETQRKALELLVKNNIKCTKSAICRWYVDNWKEEIDIAVSSGSDLIKLQTLGGPDWVYKYYPGKYLEYYQKGEILPRVIEAINYIKENYKIPVFSSLTDATRTDLSWMKQLYKGSIEAGAERIGYNDSKAAADPLTMQYLAEELKKVSKDVPITTHCHNDFGLATANTIGAVRGGVEVVDVTVNGYGDRAGNAPLEEVVICLELLYGVKTGIKKEGLFHLCKSLEKITKVKCQPHKAILGENTFLEESELHIFAMMQAKESGLGNVIYLPFNPNLVGTEHKIVWGTTSLWGEAIKLKIQKMGFNANYENIKKIKNVLSKEYDGGKNYLTDSEVENIIKSNLS